MFDRLIVKREAIETSFGVPLEWERRDDVRRCKIVKNLDVGWYADESRWAEVQDTMIDAMIRLEKAFGSRIREFRELNHDDQQRS